MIRFKAVSGEREDWKPAVGDIVQIRPNTGREADRADTVRRLAWGGTLMVVSQVRSWGVTGWCIIPAAAHVIRAAGVEYEPGSAGPHAALSYYRAKFDDVVFTGGRVWFTPTEDIEDEPTG